jgi:hypothetical protein
MVALRSNYGDTCSRTRPSTFDNAIVAPPMPRVCLQGDQPSSCARAPALPKLQPGLRAAGWFVYRWYRSEHDSGLWCVAARDRGRVHSDRGRSLDLEDPAASTWYGSVLARDVLRTLAPLMGRFRTDLVAPSSKRDQRGSLVTYWSAPDSSAGYALMASVASPPNLFRIGDRPAEGSVKLLRIQRAAAYCYTSCGHIVLTSQRRTTPNERGSDVQVSR